MSGPPAKNVETLKCGIIHFSRLDVEIVDPHLSYDLLIWRLNKRLSKPWHVGSLEHGGLETSQYIGWWKVGSGCDRADPGHPGWRQWLCRKLDKSRGRWLR